MFPRCAGLTQVNALLREQLEQAGVANQALTDGLRKAREEADQKDARLRREQEVREQIKHVAGFVRKAR